jgi:hypothetical protein
VPTGTASEQRDRCGPRVTSTHRTAAGRSSRSDGEPHRASGVELARIVLLLAAVRVGRAPILARSLDGAPVAAYHKDSFI